MIANCPVRQAQQTTPGQSQGGRNQPNWKPNRSVKVNTAQAVATEAETAVKQIEIDSATEASINLVSTNDINTHAEVYDEFIDVLLCGKVAVNDDLTDPICAVESVIGSETCEHDKNVQNDTVLLPVEVEFAELHRIDLYIKGVEGRVKCLEDSGAQIGIIKSHVLSNVNVKRVCSVKLRGIFGSPVESDLVQLQIKMSNKDDELYVPVIVAMCDSVYEQMILPRDIINRLLKSHEAVYVTTTSVDESAIVKEEVDTVKDDDLQLRRANAEELRAEQLSDETLAHC